MARPLMCQLQSYRRRRLLFGSVGLVCFIYAFVFRTNGDDADAAASLRRPEAQSIGSAEGNQQKFRGKVVIRSKVQHDDDDDDDMISLMIDIYIHLFIHIYLQIYHLAYWIVCGSKWKK